VTGEGDPEHDMEANGRLTICQISDIHCGNARFIPDLLDRTIIEINRMNPAVVVVSGDLTDAGYREEFEEAAEYIDRIECEHIMVIPGNHDARNVGYMHFERLFGERFSVLDLRAHLRNVLRGGRQAEDLRGAPPSHPPPGNGTRTEHRFRRG
jgi:3',5'-cyclic AMP phosphodiesterase CpdA